MNWPYSIYDYAVDFNSVIVARWFSGGHPSQVILFFCDDFQSAVEYAAESGYLKDDPYTMTTIIDNRVPVPEERAGMLGEPEA